MAGNSLSFSIANILVKRSTVSYPGSSSTEASNTDKQPQLSSPDRDPISLPERPAGGCGRLLLLSDESGESTDTTASGSPPGAVSRSLREGIIDIIAAIGTEHNTSMLYSVLFT